MTERRIKASLSVLAGVASLYSGSAMGQTCPYDPRCINNPYGAGSPYSPNSVNNPYGRYGSPYSNDSANNPYATNPPVIYNQQGQEVGRLSANPYLQGSTSGLGNPMQYQPPGTYYISRPPQ